MNTINPVDAARIYHGRPIRVGFLFPKQGAPTACMGGLLSWAMSWGEGTNGRPRQRTAFRLASDFAKFIADETEKWAKVVKFAGLKLD
jgi:hypothetical protein